MPIKLFTYGSLKKGFHNHNILSNNGAKFVCEETLLNYEMYDTGYNFPAIVRKEGSVVHGEVYEIEESLVKQLDILEGYIGEGDKDNLYKRRMVSTNGKAVIVYIYEKSVSGLKKVKDGFWEKPQLKPYLELGGIYMTRGVGELLNSEEINNLITRHATGDYGNLSEEDLKANERAVRLGNDRVFSSYKVNNKEVWVITEWDRSSTTVLLPSEY